MIAPAAWSNQASGAAAQRLSGEFGLAVLADLDAGTAVEQVGWAAPGSVERCAIRESFGWGCDWGATLFKG